jgi:L-ribulose-5-phosphate 3-epimerase
MTGLDSITVGIYEKALPLTMTWPERLTAAAQAGFDFLELSIDESDERLERLDWRPAQRAELRQAIYDVGLPITSMCLSGHRKYPMGSASKAIHERGLDIMKKAVDLARDIGVRIVLVPGYDVFYEPSDEGTKARFLEGLRKGVAWASSVGVMLALENTEKFVTSITHAMWYVNEVNSPWLQLYGDIGNLLALGHDMLTELDAGAGHLAGIHIKDAVLGEGRGIPFGQGEVPFVSAFRKLREIGFNGPIMLEMWADGSSDALRVVADAREWVMARIEECKGNEPTPAPQSKREDVL